MEITLGRCGWWAGPGGSAGELGEVAFSGPELRIEVALDVAG